MTIEAHDRSWYHTFMHNSLPLSRRDAIAARLAQGEPVVAAAMAKEFRISEDAIRRDLRALAAEGKCRRVYGGALPLNSSLPMAVRIEQGVERKQALARSAITLIEPDEFVFLDSGSTNLCMVSLLPENLRITLATNSIDIAAAVMKRGDLPLIVIGGTLNLPIGGCVDASAIASVERLNIDRCFIGACAISPTRGISVFDYADAIFKRALLKRSRSCVAMTTIEKLQERAPHRIATPRDIDHLVIEHSTAVADAEALADAGFAVVRAGEL
jgi:DeoR/GlpR family transcriptional regulator of sugar metabolism